MRVAFSIVIAGLGMSFATDLLADEKTTLELKVIAKKDSYVLDRGGKSAAEYRKMLDEAGANKKGFGGNYPRPPAVDLALEIKNAGKEAVMIYVGGDSNLWTFDLKGPATFQVRPLLAFTQEFRIPKGVALEPGKSYEIPIKQLADGHRGASRYLYWLDAGEYTLGATYQLSGAEGGKGPMLKAEPIKLKVEEKK